jgi:hypothetical protein
MHFNWRRKTFLNVEILLCLKMVFVRFLKLFFKLLSPTALKIFYRCRRHRVKFFNAVADSGKKL